MTKNLRFSNLCWESVNHHTTLLAVFFNFLNLSPQETLHSYVIFLSSPLLTTNIGQLPVTSNLFPATKKETRYYLLFHCPLFFYQFRFFKGVYLKINSLKIYNFLKLFFPATAVHLWACHNNIKTPFLHLQNPLKEITTGSYFPTTTVPKIVITMLESKLVVSDIPNMSLSSSFFFFNLL
jgi:hypothetical protein